MATARDSQPEMYLNLYNGGQSYVSHSISPSPSVHSDNSIEFVKDQLHDDDADSSGSSNDSAQELTNLTWLTQLKNLVEWPNSINPILDEEADNRGGSNGSISTPLTKKDTLNERFQRFVGQAKKNREAYSKLAEIYKMDTTDKPPFNYAQMIAMAMLENGRMTLQHIYSWIQSKFGYYRARNNWNNSIRHNLSLQFCFRKIDRNVYNKGDGKGGYWELGIDASKSERKRVRNRNGIRLGQKNSHSVIKNKRRTHCKDGMTATKPTSSTVHDLDLIINNFADGRDNYLFNRTLNSINASVSVDTSLPTDELGIGSIIEVQDNQNQDNPLEYNQPLTEFHILADITHGDLLNINAMELMSSTDDVFNSNNFLTSAVLTAGESTSDSTIPTIITTMADSTPLETECCNEIFLASQVPQPSENVVISALNSYDDDTTFHNHSINIISDPSYANTISDNDGTNSMKSYVLEGMDQEFQLLANCTLNGRPDFIEKTFGID